MKTDSERALTISIEEVRQLQIKGKPECPYCQNPLSHVYNDMLKGHISLKCGRCKKKSIVDVETMQALMFPDDKAG